MPETPSGCLPRARNSFSERTKKNPERWEGIRATFYRGSASQYAAASRPVSWGANICRYCLLGCCSWYRMNPRNVTAQVPEVKSLLRNARNAARRGSCIAKALGRVVFVAVALLVVTVGTLATESRLYTTGRNSTSWHTSKSSRMAECGGEKLAPAQTDDARSFAPFAPFHQTEKIAFYRISPIIVVPLPEIAGVPQSHGLRAPPLS